MSQWRIEILGKFAASGPKGPVGRFRTSKCKELLTHLALYPAGKTRDELGEALWPDMPEDKQGRNVRYTLSIVRSKFGRTPFVEENGPLEALIPEMCIDAREWRTALNAALKERGAPRRAELLEVLLDKGFPTLLPGCYADWLQQERRSWNAIAADGVVALCWAFIEIRRRDRAAYWLRVGEDTFPEREDEWAQIRDANESPSDLESVDGFFGRDKEFVSLRNWLKAPERSERLITITGSGGIGKTRLALEASAGIPIVSVELAKCTEEMRAWDVLRQSLKLGPTDTPKEAVVSCLSRSDAPGLLFLDNLEQLGADGYRLVSSLLNCNPTISILVTSQRLLGLPGEDYIELKPLGDKYSYDLFINRARRESPEFGTHPGSVPIVQKICTILQGIPLAIELAAARAGLLSPDQILKQLDAALKFLTSRSKDLPERHKSVRAALGWSIDLLTPSTQRALRKLSVFRAGFSLEAALCVCGEDAVDDLLELTKSSILVVVKDDANQSSYFRLHAFLESLLKEDYPDEMRENFDSYFDYYSRLFNTLDNNRVEGMGRDNELIVKSDILNIVYVLERGFEYKEEDVMLEVVKSIMRVLYDLGYWVDFLNIAKKAEGFKKNTSRISILGFLGAINRVYGDENLAMRYWSERLECCTQEGNLDLLVDTKVDIANLKIVMGDWESVSAVLKEFRGERDKFSNSVRLKYLLLESEYNQEQGRCNVSDSCISQALEMGDKLNYGEKVYAYLKISNIYRKRRDEKRCYVYLNKGLYLCSEKKLVYPALILLENLIYVCKEIEKLDAMAYAVWVRACTSVVLDNRTKQGALEEWDRVPHNCKKKSWCEPLTASAQGFSWNTEIVSLLRGLSQDRVLANILQTVE